MSEEAKHILASLLELPVNERIWVIQEGLDSFIESPEKKELWDFPSFYAEMQKRLDDYDSGKDSGISVDDAFAQMRKII
jgi:putative addiction module component (TIGR02574 family)